MLVKLTASNQTDLILEDARQWQRGAKGRPHYGMMTHILLLSKRLDTLEAKAIEARSDETASAGSARKGKSAGRKASPHTPSTPHQDKED